MQYRRRGQPRPKLTLQQKHKCRKAIWSMWSIESLKSSWTTAAYDREYTRVVYMYSDFHSFFFCGAFVRVPQFSVKCKRRANRNERDNGPDGRPTNCKNNLIGRLDSGS
eukprot:GEMP01089372.1.p2 GENE.GEMP01089372.1~~GEMP01089372.1.p2  ORF type:complete len:109 (+),score=6.66 GEMP01089372.1:368-694(+)